VEVSPMICRSCATVSFGFTASSLPARLVTYGAASEVPDVLMPSPVGALEGTLKSGVEG
jgi:hypothetical protein